MGQAMCIEKDTTQPRNKSVTRRKTQHFSLKSFSFIEDIQFPSDNQSDGNFSEQQHYLEENSINQQYTLLNYQQHLTNNDTELKPINLYQRFSTGRYSKNNDETSKANEETRYDFSDNYYQKKNSSENEIKAELEQDVKYQQQIQVQS